MHIAPERSEDRNLDDLSVSEIMGEALEMWADLTGVRHDDTSFRFGDLNVRDMNEMIRESVAREPGGVTAFMMLEVFLREFLESRKFTAAEIMKDYAATTAFLGKAEALFRVTQSDRAVEELAAFRSSVLAGLRRYGADRDDVVALINGSDALPFLRRDAIESLHSLQPYQFLSGDAGEGPAQVIQNVYQAWNINDLLISLRDMPVNGIALVLLRDPSNPDRSYFAFAMRNGGNVTIFTDKRRPAYPGQEDALAGRGGRSIGRAFMSRAWANHFPYQLIKTSIDENGDVVFEDETAPVLHGKNLVPLMRIADLPPAQAVWVTMMLSLVADKFWKKFWQAEKISYTGDMVRRRDLLVSDRSGAPLPVASGYAPIALEPVTVAEAASHPSLEVFASRRSGVNDWLVERYRDSAPDDLMNLWFAKPGAVAILPPLSYGGSSWEERSSREIIEAGDPVPGGAVMVAVPDARKTTRTVSGYGLKTFSPVDFGSEDELKKDRLFIARHNLAMFVQREADREFSERRDEVARWYLNALGRNVEGIIDIVASHMAGRPVLGREKGGYVRFTIGNRNGGEFRYVNDHHNVMGERNEITGRAHCLLTGVMKADTRVRLDPHNAEEISLVTGVAVSDLPDVLRHWRYEKPYVGNDLLDRVDPFDAQIRNPWYKLCMSLNFYLSKRGLDKVTAMSEARRQIISDQKGATK